MKRYLAIVLLAVAAFALPPAARAEARIYVQIGPPAEVVEVRPGAPGPHHYWVPGHHRWDGHAYVWVGGRWEMPPRHHHAWVRGHWVHHRRHGWYWVEGHWK